MFIVMMCDTKSFCLLVFERQSYQICIASDIANIQDQIIRCEDFVLPKSPYSSALNIEIGGALLINFYLLIFCVVYDINDEILLIHSYIGIGVDVFVPAELIDNHTCVRALHEDVKTGSCVQVRCVTVVALTCLCFELDFMNIKNMKSSQAKLWLP